MFARGLVSLHTPPLLGRKPSSAKSRVSISSKLIEIKRLQLQHFGHVQKTGGSGRYRLVHTAHDPVRKSPPLTPAFPPLARPTLNMTIFYILPTIGGRVPLVRPNRQNSSQAQPARPFQPYAKTSAFYDSALPTSHQSPITSHQSPVTLPRPIALQPPWCQNHHIAGTQPGDPKRESLGKGNIYPLPGV